MRYPFCDHHISAFLEDYRLSNKPLDLALSNYFKNHKSIGAQDRRTIGEAIYGLFRWKTLVDLLAPSELPIDRLYCFKKISFEEVTQNPFLPEAARLGISEFLFEKLKAAYGDRTQSICKILNTVAPVTLRANFIKTTREALFEALSKKFSISLCEKSASGILLKKREALFALQEFKEGLFEVQDEGSQLVADLVAAKPGDHVLDYCSGSGGKTLAFAHKMQGKGQIYLHDSREHILLEARKRLKRAGVQNAQFVLPRKKVDWVLADVPCSGTGTLRRNPDAKWKIDQPMIDRLIEQQRSIVAEALQHLSPNGRFVYATCSILPEENEQQIQYFIKTHSLELEGDPLFLLPEENGSDGFFAAVLKRNPLV